MPSAVPSLTPDSRDADLGLAILLAEQRLRAALRRDRCTRCRLPVDPRATCAVNRAAGHVYHADCARPVTP